MPEVNESNQEGLGGVDVDWACAARSVSPPKLIKPNVSSPTPQPIEIARNLALTPRILDNSTRVRCSSVPQNVNRSLVTKVLAMRRLQSRWKQLAACADSPTSFYKSTQAVDNLQPNFRPGLVLMNLPPTAGALR